MFINLWRRFRCSSRSTKSRSPISLSRLTACVLLLVQIGAVQAQAFSESFNDITTLEASGWEISNASAPLGTRSWFQGSPDTYPANSGAANSFIAVNYLSTDSKGTISNWLMMPQRTLSNGDVLTFYTRTPADTEWADRLEVRMSTKGDSTNVGSGVEEGDYTTLLLSINPTLVASAYPQVWTKYTVTVEGLAAPTSGRLAFRYFVTDAGEYGTNSNHVGIDDVVYTPYGCSVITLSDNLPATAMVGQAFNHAFDANGASHTAIYSISSGALPSGLELSSSGLLTGIPTEIAGFNFTVTVTDAGGCGGSRTFTIDVNNGDTDGDGVLDATDVCPQDPQDDCLANGNGDFDEDGIKNSDDICPEDAVNNCLANGDGDLDGDDVKNSDDVCPEDETNSCPAGDLDNDGITNGDDFCPMDAANNCLENPAADTDGDIVVNSVDNCPLVGNVEQEDLDGDGKGDVCDEDKDGDGVPNERDDYPLDPERYTDPAAVEKSGDAAKQAYGQVLHNVGDINDDLVDDYVIGTPNYTALVDVNGKTKKLAKAGKVELFSGKTGELLWAREGTAKQQLFGSAIASGSIPNDGWIDIAIGAPGANKKTGEVFSCYFEREDDQVVCSDERTFAPDASFKGSLYGSSVVIAEGVGLFVGAPKAKNISADSMSVAEPLLNKSVGAVLFYSRTDLSQLQMAFFGSALNGELGASLAWLPTYQQLAMGAPRANKTGEVYLWDLNDDISITQRGAANGELFGKTLAVGSMADGAEHLAVSAPQAANDKLKKAGRVDVFAVEDGAFVAEESYLGSSKAEQLGMSLTFAAIANGENDSLFAGSPFYSVPKSSGSKALARAGKVSRFILADTQPQAEIIGEQAKQQLGASIAAIDLTGEFKLDILAASTGANDPVNKKLKAAGKVELLESSQW